MSQQPPKKVVLYLITQSHLGGAQKHLADLLKYLHDRYEIHLALGSVGYLSEVATSLNIKVHVIASLQRSIKLTDDLRALSEFRALVRQIQPDLIHAHSSKPGVIARIAGKLCNKPVIFTVHGWGFDERVPLLRRTIALIFEKLMAPLTTISICVCKSDYDAGLERGIFTRDRAVVIYNGAEDVDLPLASPAQQPPRLIMVARFDNNQKDQLSAIAAFAKLARDFGEVRLDFVGAGVDLEQAKSVAASLGVADKVAFLGTRTDIPELLSQAQIFLLSTHYEGLPISILEAMRAGLPIVATDVNGIREQVDDGVNGYLVPHQDVSALTQALSKLIAASELRQQMGKMSRQKFMNEFTIDKTIEQVGDLYDRTLQDFHY